MKVRNMAIAQIVRQYGLLCLLLVGAALAPIPASGGEAGEAGPRHAAFNGNAYADLAVGIVGKDVDEKEDAGAVSVLYGSPVGLSAAGNQVWDQASPDIEGTVDEGEYFGSALAIGDFNGDGYPDLAVGVPWEDADGVVILAGAVNVLYGSATGLDTPGNQLWNQDSPDIEGLAEEWEEFGHSLATGDLNGDGYDDLAVGVPYEAVDGFDEAGAVNILYGSATGLSAMGNQLWTQNSPDVQGEAARWEEFGRALAAGDLNGDGYDDLAVGIPGESVGPVRGAGAVQILYGSESGLSAVGNQIWDQDSQDIMDMAEEWDELGRTLVTGDLNGDGYVDLAVGIPYEDVGSVADAGAVQVLFGSATGLVAAGNQIWDQDSPGVSDMAEEWDEFGRALAVSDLNGDGYTDLAIGVPWEEVESAEDAGAVSVLYGSAAGLSAAGNQLWHQGLPEVEDTGEQDDGFGYTLAAGDLNGDGYGDLAIGVPWEELGSTEDAGAVSVLYGSASGLSAAGNQIWDQDSPDMVGTGAPYDYFGLCLATVPTVETGSRVFLPLVVRDW